MTSEDRPVRVETDAEAEASVVGQMLSQLSKFDLATRQRIIQTLATFYGVPLRGITTVASPRASENSVLGVAGLESSFSEDRSISPKQFMFEKQPQTDVEKVTCLAYYLTHYRNMPHFKTLDISKLNTDAAQIKFSNPAVAVDNAVKTKYLVPATKGNRQLSAQGELFVQALPDREKAKAIMANVRPRRKSRRPDSESERRQENEDFEERQN
jgi:hypothetical protein